MPRAVEITIPNNWKPRFYQRKLWSYLQKGGKRAAALWHRRAGKDDICLHWTAVAAMQKPGNYWHMLPQANQARRAIWDAVNPHTGQRRIDEAFPAEIRKNTRNHEMAIEFINGSWWNVVGSDNYNSLVGAPPVGIVFSEWSLADPNCWAYLRPILLENDGWALFVYTSRGNNHGASTYYHAVADSEWFGEILTARDTDVFSDSQLASELREYQVQYGEDYGTAIYNQEYMCSLSGAMRGSYYGRQLERLEADDCITDVPYDPNYKVETWWDIGINDPTAIWFVQRTRGGVIRVIDYYEGSGVGLQTYAKVLNKLEYMYSYHVGPHDIGNREFGGDGSTRIEMGRKLGLNFKVAPKVPIDDGIHAVQTMLPKCVFDKKKCAKGLNALRSYHAEFDQKHNILRPKPCHDWSSHAADAIRTGAVYRPSSEDFNRPIEYQKRRYA